MGRPRIDGVAGGPRIMVTAGAERQSLVDRLVAAALLLAIHPSGGTDASAVRLARLADGRVQALERARAQILRRADGRPTRVSAQAAATLGMARGLVPGRRSAGRDGAADGGDGTG